MYKIDAANGVRVCGERSHETCGSHVPHEESFVVGAGGKNVSAGGERESVDV